MASYKDIRRETGLSLSTISKYFNGQPVREPNRVAIEAAAERMDFRPNQVARSLRLQRSEMVGVLLPVLDSEFHLSIIAGAEAALREAGISVIVAVSPSPEHGAVDLLRRQMVDGILAVASVHDVEGLLGAAEKIPIVLLDHKMPGLPFDGVFLDNAAAGAMGVRHLLDHGHRSIALIAGEHWVPTMTERVEGALAELELVPDAEATVEYLRQDVDSARDAVAALLSSRSRPTAIFALNDQLMLGAIAAVNESGLRLGREISLVGFDGVDFARSMKPRITVIAQRTHDIASTAVEMMKERLFEASGEERSPVVTRVLPPMLVTGGSVGRVDD